ncbi:MAG: uL15 family ribosomal protein [Candidatus Diapherotrites archaeon]|nr:uL15 family ribosomal protein [Candidatus Diapherotrites archaeon]
MVVRAERKIRKQRGSRLCGKGDTKHHRGAGCRGGHGNAGSHKHKFTFFIKHKKNHFSKKHQRKISDWVKIVNIGTIDQSINRLVETGKVTQEKGFFVVDANALGVEKILGSGKVLNKIKLISGNVSKKAAEKIVAAKGQVVSGNENEEPVAQKA